jgi:Predicted glycosyltransferases
MNNLITPIVTINYNGREDTCDLIGSLIKSGDLFSLVVVDNCSPRENEFENLKKEIHEKFGIIFSDSQFNDPSVTACLFGPFENGSSVFLLRSSNNGGFSKGTNIGLRFAFSIFPKTEFIAILNNDTIVTSHFLRNAISPMEDNKILAVMGTILYYGYDHPYIWSIGGRIDWVKGQGIHEHKDEILDISSEKRDVVYRTFISGCFTVFRSSALKSIGLLDESYFFAGEEYQYSVDLCKKGKIAWVPSSVIYHKSVLGIGNGSSHNIKSLPWQWNAYMVKICFVNKNKAFLFRKFWHLLLRAHINVRIKKQYLSSGITKKDFSLFRSSLFKNINRISYDSNDFLAFKSLFPAEKKS